MKTLKILLTLSFICATFAFTSCLKKGEDDPLISLRTRNNRLIGEWKLVSMESESIYNYTYNGQYQNNKTNVKFDGTILTVIESENNNGNYSYTSTVSVYSMTMTINKNGTWLCSTSQTQTSPTPAATQTYIETNYWYWMDSKKSKTQLLLDLDVVYAVTKLSNKELVLEKVVVDEATENSETSNDNEKLVFEKK